jgi:outer membrane protein OmpA-like peptidoglycan-associated protein
MYLIHNKNIFLSLSPAFVAKVATLSIVLVFAGQTNSQSQSNTLMDYSHPNVTVDLSVISGEGYNQSANLGSGILPSLSNRNLLRPGDQTPRSMLHVPLASVAPRIQAKKSAKIWAAPKSTLHVPAARGAPVVQTKKIIKAWAAPKKALARSAKSTSIAAIKPARKSPPPAAKIPLTAKKVAQLKPVTTAKALKKLQAPAKQAATKLAPVRVVTVKKTAPPLTPVIKPAPNIAKKETPKPAATTVQTLAKQQASLPPATAPAETDKKLRVSFAPDQTKLPASAKPPLIILAASLKGTDNQRLQLIAYAGGPSLSSSLARRMSLSRALAIRSFLIENGVRSTRIDVRALGNKTTEEPFNRVDLNITER